MKIIDCLTRLNTLKPNQYGDEMLVQWLSDVDGLIYNEYICGHEGAPAECPGPYDPLEDLETELLAPEPYSVVYINYLMAQVDFCNADYARYNNSMVMYNTALSAYVDSYNRTHMPKQTVVRW